MLADLDETLRQLLIAELPIKNGEIDISFDQPKREWSARLTRPTINLFLYDLRDNPNLRHHGWETVGNNHNAADQLAHLKRTPFRADCTYILTTWAAEAEDEHRLLSRCLIALFRHPVLPEERLVGHLKAQPFELQARLAVHDKLTNVADLWTGLDNEVRPSVPYIITLAFDPWSEITGPIVRTLTFRWGQAARLPRKQGLGAVEADLTLIGGVVSSSDGPNKPIAEIEVAIKGTGLFTKTDDHGRFTLGNLPPGDYTLVAWPAQGKPREKKISVPSPEGDYNLQL
jgi:hypothetical protein